MKFSCTRSELQAAVAIAAKAASAKSPIPALEGILIETTLNGVKLTGYDLKKGIYTNFAADVVQGGSIVVNSRLFGEIIRKLPDGIVMINGIDGVDDVAEGIFRAEAAFADLVRSEGADRFVHRPVGALCGFI